jgi:hypothetical protein
MHENIAYRHFLDDLRLRLRISDGDPEGIVDSEIT